MQEVSVKYYIQYGTCPLGFQHKYQNSNSVNSQRANKLLYKLPEKVRIYGMLTMIARSGLFS
jgi:hypothetical protein